MWIERLDATAFGPFHEQKLELGPGMNVVVGPNESGKSSWHGAIYAALCGLRRTKGSRRSDERDFIARHKPWNSSQWRVTAIIHTSGDRTIELRQNLANLVDCRATDLALGRDVSNEIMNGGSPDASKWLGLDRTSFRATACVRQADVLEVQRSPRVLQSALQRAAASVPADSTASEALIRLQEFEAEQIGSDRAPTRPLRQAQSKVERASDELREARNDHLDYVLLASQVNLARTVAEGAASRLRAGLAARAEVSARTLEERYDEVRRLSAKFKDMEPPRLSGPEDDLARQISAALDRFRRRPALPSPGPSSSESIRQAIATAERSSGGDIEMHPTVEMAWRSWWESSSALQRHGRVQPAEFPAPDAAGYTADELSDIAAEIAHAPQMRVATRGESAPAGLAVFLTLGVAILGLVAALLGSVIPGLLVFIASVAAAGTLHYNRKPSTVPTQESRDNSLVTRLEEQGLPLNAPAIRSLATAMRDYERAETDLLKWRESREALVLEDRRCQEELRQALRDRGHPVGQDQLTADALQAYQQACALRRDGAAQSGALRSELAAAELREGQYAAIVHELQAVEAELRRLAALAGIPIDPDAAMEFIAATLQGWENQRRLKLGELDTQQREWSRLEALLDGHAIEDLEVHASLARNVARAASVGVDEVEFTEFLNAFSAGSGQAQLDAAARADQEAREEMARLSERLRLRASSMKDVAAAEEALESARIGLNRLRDLAEVVRLTQKFMSSAADRAHRTIAPLIQATLSEHISVATHGRYVEALVDPESLEVRVKTTEGYWRSASALSHGTTEQIYLLLRVALAEHLVVAGECAPLILDEVTVHSDAQRTKAVLDTLLMLSLRRQVILFSQEVEVAEWARDNLDMSRDRLVALAELPV